MEQLGEWQVTERSLYHKCSRILEGHLGCIYNMDNELFECLSCGDPVPVEILDVAILAGHDFSTYTGYYGG